MPTEGIVPYRICEIVITKNTSVNTDPQRWIVDPIGIAKSTMPIVITVVLLVFIIYQQNQKKKEEYFLREISNNLRNCVGCTKDSCHCETKSNIERLTKEYLGGDVAFIGNIINYIEDSKRISPKKYYKLYQRIQEEKFDEDIMLKKRK